MPSTKVPRAISKDRSRMSATLFNLPFYHNSAREAEMAQTSTESYHEDSQRIRFARALCEDDPQIQPYSVSS